MFAVLFLEEFLKVYYGVIKLLMIVKLDFLSYFSPGNIIAKWRRGRDLVCRYLFMRRLSLSHQAGARCICFPDGLCQR